MREAAMRWTMPHISVAICLGVFGGYVAVSNGLPFKQAAALSAAITSLTLTLIEYCLDRHGYDLEENIQIDPEDPRLRPPGLPGTVT